MRVLLGVGLGGMLLALIATHRAVDLDVFHAMALFREALALGHLPMADPFAYTPTWPRVVHHEWGAGAVYYAFWEGLRLGPLGLSLLRFALIAGIVAVTWRHARRRGATDAALAVAAPAALYLLVYGLSPVRAQMFTLLLVAVLLLLLDRDREGRRGWIPGWLVLWVLWVNLHGGFVVGLGAVGVTTAERFVEAWRAEGARGALRRTWHLAAVAAAMAALALVNPWGAEYFAYLARALAMARPDIAEWAPLWDPRVELRLVLVYAASLALLGYAVARGAARGRGLAFVLAAALAALLSQRHAPIYAVAWFTVVAPALAGTELGRTVEALFTRRRAAAAAALLAFAAAGVGSVALRRTWDLRVPDDDTFGAGRLMYPVGAVEHLAAAAFAGRLLTRFEDGAYVSWRLHPAVKVSLDSRYEAAYLPGLFEEHRAFYEAAPGWEGFLARYPPDAILLPCAYPVVARLDALPGWTRAFRDARYCLHLRAGATAARAAPATPAAATR